MWLAACIDQCSELLLKEKQGCSITAVTGSSQNAEKWRVGNVACLSGIARNGSEISRTATIRKSPFDINVEHP